MEADQRPRDAERQEQRPHRHREAEPVEEGERDRPGQDARDEREREVTRLRVRPPASAAHQDHDRGDRDRDERDGPDDAAADEQPEVVVVEDPVLGQEGAQATAEPGCVDEELPGDRVAVGPGGDARVVLHTAEHAADRAEQPGDTGGQHDGHGEERPADPPAQRRRPAPQEHEHADREADVRRAGHGQRQGQGDRRDREPAPENPRPAGWSAPCRASGRRIDRSAPNSIGLVAVPEMRTRPLRKAALMSLTAVRPGIAMRSTRGCLVTYCASPTSAIRPPMKANLRTSTSTSRSLVRPSCAVSRTPGPRDDDEQGDVGRADLVPVDRSRHRCHVADADGDQEVRERDPDRSSRPGHARGAPELREEPHQRAGETEQRRRCARAAQRVEHQPRRDAEQKDEVDGQPREDAGRPEGVPRPGGRDRRATHDG